MKTQVSFLLVVLSSLFYGSLYADKFYGENTWGVVSPVCLSKQGTPLPINTKQVMGWKKTTKNQYQDRAHLVGKISRIYANKSGHRHFAITIGDDFEFDTIEIIYNEDFGVLPAIDLGMKVEACGDYITATAKSGPYPPSPDGAIVHWVHKSPSGKHAHGYVIIEGVLYGDDFTNASRR